MRIAFVIDNLGSGGAQRQVTELAIRLRASGRAETRVLVYHPQDFFRPALREAGVPVVDVPRASGLDPRLPWRIGRHLRAEGIEVVHAFLTTAALWTWLAVRSLPRRSRPVFLAAERSALVEAFRHDTRVRRLVYARSDAVTVNATPMLDQIHEHLGTPRERLHYLPNGIDLEAWDAAGAEAPPLEIEPAGLRIALVGGLRPEKNHALLFEALERLGPERTADWRVWCIGGRTAGAGPAREIEQDIERRGLGGIVRLAPPVRNVAAVLARMDALVLCSVFEGFPNVVLEAMASRLPVVATRVGDVPNLVVPGGSGFLVGPGDAAGLAAALDRLASLPAAERAALGARGRARVEERFRMEAVADAHLALYRRLAGGREGRPAQ